MIAKLETGNGFGGALRYDVRHGKGDDEKELAHVLDAAGVCVDYDDKGSLLINPNRVGFDFRQQTMAYTGPGTIRKPVYHWVLSYSPNDKVSEEQMVKDAHEFLERTGFADTQYVMTAHFDKEHTHLHILTNIVDNNGNRIPTTGLIDKAHEVSADITKRNGYTWGEKTKQENITADKIHKPHDRARKIIEPQIREALAASSSIPGLQRLLKEKYDIECHYTSADDGKRGYGRMSFSYNYEGQQHTFSGSQVARELSYGYIYQTLFTKAKELAEKDYPCPPDARGDRYQYIVRDEYNGAIFHTHETRTTDWQRSKQDEHVRDVLCRHLLGCKGIEGKNAFYDSFAYNMVLSENFLVGEMFYDGKKITYGRETMYGDATQSFSVKADVAERAKVKSLDAERAKVAERGAERAVHANQGAGVNYIPNLGGGGIAARNPGGGSSSVGTTLPTDDGLMSAEIARLIEGMDELSASEKEERIHEIEEAKKIAKAKNFGMHL